MFSREYCQIFESSFFHITPPVATSDPNIQYIHLVILFSTLNLYLLDVKQLCLFTLYNNHGENLVGGLSSPRKLFQTQLIYLLQSEVVLSSVVPIMQVDHDYKQV